jgi:hypothetical protein
LKNRRKSCEKLRRKDCGKKKELTDMAHGGGGGGGNL